MKFLASFLFTALLLVNAPLSAQLSDDVDADTPPPVGSTLINADELHSDEATHVSDFVGNVVVVGQNFHMSCQEMKVYFTTNNKVDKIVATGEVVITQPGRVTHCGHAEYYQDSDVFDLTEEPVIYQGKDKLTGTEIIIDRKSQKLTTRGGRTTVTLDNASMNTATTTPNGAVTGTDTPNSNLPTK